VNKENSVLCNLGKVKRMTIRSKLNKTPVFLTILHIALVIRIAKEKVETNFINSRNLDSKAQKHFFAWQTTYQ